ncbi:MAG: cupin domain-containing protein [Bacteroidetes bacterium]|nr:cupin domain-containing protein [Bacteroidota bacterium]
MTSAPVHPAGIAAVLPDLWAPRVIAEVDDMYVKVGRVQGDFCWHVHEEEDELFYVLKGSLRIEMEAGTIELCTGELFVVPKGTQHKPVADGECHIMLMERKSTEHTGDVVNDMTRSIDDQLSAPESQSSDTTRSL